MLAALYASLPALVASVVVEAATQRGNAYIVVRFRGGGALKDTAWVIEMGLGSGAKALAAKMAQAQEYAQAITLPT